MARKNSDPLIFWKGWGRIVYEMATPMVKKSEVFMIFALLVLLYNNETGSFFCPYFSAMLVFLNHSLHNFLCFAAVLQQKSTSISCDLERTVKPWFERTSGSAAWMLQAAKDSLAIQLWSSVAEGSIKGMPLLLAGSTAAEASFYRFETPGFSSIVAVLYKQHMLCLSFQPSSCWELSLMSGEVTLKVYVPLHYRMMSYTHIIMQSHVI